MIVWTPYPIYPSNMDDDGGWFQPQAHFETYAFTVVKLEIIHEPDPKIFVEVSPSGWFWPNYNISPTSISLK